MDLFERVSEDIKTAMKAKDKVALETLRNIKKVFLEAKTAPGANDTLTDDAALKIMQKLMKQGKDAAEIYIQQGRQDLADEELAQVKVIEIYLPKQMSAEELEAALKDEKFGSELLGSALFTQFMVYVNRIFLEKQYIFDKKSYTFDSQIASILQYINHNLKEDLSVETLSARYYVSKYHLMRKFKQETGYTLHNYIVNKRLLMARTLISNGMPVTKAAQESGFAEYSTFSRAYRKQFKTNPSEELPHYSNPLK